MIKDLYFFDFKQALEEFTKHYEFFTEDVNKQIINKQKLHDYFISGIASGTKKEVEIFGINCGAKSKNINYINKQGVKFVDLNKNSIIEEIKFSEEEQMLNPPMKISTDIFVLDENVLGCTKEKVYYVQNITKLYMD